LPQHISLSAAVVICLILSKAVPARADIGQFETSADVGKVEPAGSAAFDKESNQYKITASGANIWAKIDAFHFLYRKISGDVTLAADIAFVGEGKNPHRKAGWMIRQSLDADAPYVDVMVHGEGLIALQYRSEKGGITKGIDAKIKSPATVKLQRRGDTFTLLVIPKGEAPVSVGEIKLTMPDPVYAGLAVCSHDAATPETAVFSNVSLEPHLTK
jgi:TolB protein